jgi:hypothetical protein
VALLALDLLAPSGAQAGCSHLVTSRAHRHEVAALTESLIHDLAVPSSPLPEPSGRRPCSGMSCSGQPAVPAVPAGMTDGRIDSWAWCSAIPGSAPTVLSILSWATIAPQPMHSMIAVFWPPRPLSPA